MLLLLFALNQSNERHSLAQRKIFGHSWIHPKVTGTRMQRFVLGFASPLFVLHQILITANVLVIIGGSLQSSGIARGETNTPKVRQGRIFRAIGQAGIVSCVLACVSSPESSTCTD